MGQVMLRLLADEPPSNAPMRGGRKLIMTSNPIPIGSKAALPRLSK